jgi:hypothetical protein
MIIFSRKYEYILFDNFFLQIDLLKYFLFSQSSDNFKIFFVFTKPPNLIHASILTSSDYVPPTVIMGMGPWSSQSQLMI